jgi:hypothetical protein
MPCTTCNIEATRYSEMKTALRLTSSSPALLGAEPATQPTTKPAERWGNCIFRSPKKPVYQITVKYPLDWRKLTEKMGEGDEVIFYKPQGKKASASWATFDICDFSEGSLEQKMDETVKIKMAVKIQEKEGLKILDQGILTLNKKYRAGFILSSYANDGQEYVEREVYIYLSETRCFVVFEKSFQKTYKENKELLMNMTDSLVFEKLKDDE